MVVRTSVEAICEMTRSIDDLVSAVAVMFRLGSELGDIGPTLKTVHKTRAGVLNSEL